MGLITGTRRELLYSNAVAGTPALSIVAGAEASLMVGLPPVRIPAYFFNAVGKSLSVRCIGRWTPNGIFGFFSLRLLPTPLFATTSGIVFHSSNHDFTVTTQAIFILIADITLQSIGIGPTSVLSVMGEIHSPNGLNCTGLEPAVSSIPAANSVISTSVFDVNVDSYLFLSVTNTFTSNTITSANIEMLKVWGEN